jgi:hypothetical protein
MGEIFEKMKYFYLIFTFLPSQNPLFVHFLPFSRNLGTALLYYARKIFTLRFKLKAITHISK